MGKKINLKIINIIFIIFLIILLTYIGYRHSIFYENFEEKTKIVGTSTILDGKGNSTQSNGPSSNTVKIIDPKPSYEKNNELPEKAVSSPAEIEATNKIIKATVPKAPKPLKLDFDPEKKLGANDKKSADISAIPREMNPDLPPLNSGPVPLDPSSLTAREKQLFDAFLEKRITDDKVHELIESGVLNEQLVEKFLKLIDDLPVGPSVNKAPKKLAKNYPVDKESRNENLVEGFTGSMYAVSRW
jgi:hypothetical protein